MIEHRVFKESRNILWELRVWFGGAVVRHCLFLELLVQNEGCVGSRWEHNTVQAFRTMAHNTHTHHPWGISTLRWPLFSTGHLAKTKLFRLSSYSLESAFWNVRIVQSLFSKCFCNWEVLKGQQQGWHVVTPSTEVSFQKWAQWFASYYPIFGKKWAFLPLPKQPSMYGIFTYINGWFLW